jgi:hypothetical protein
MSEPDLGVIIDCVSATHHHGRSRRRRRRRRHRWEECFFLRGIAGLGES